MGKPGLTGYWPVCGRFNAEYDTGERQRLELEYYTKRGFWYDLGLVFRTIPAVIRGRGAE
jgi:lipopolysaccharide/colanic/teichoic acid biosynthesis glycosyltransferase